MYNRVNVNIYGADDMQTDDNTNYYTRVSYIILTKGRKTSKLYNKEQFKELINKFYSENIKIIADIRQQLLSLDNIPNA